MFLKNQKGVTLVELLVAISLFSIVAVVSSAVLLDIVQLEKKSSVQNAFYDDIRVVLQQLTNEIQAGTIDYEEYYNINVIKSSYYGINYGAYGSRFYDPGRSLVDGNNTTNPEHLGVECSYPTLTMPPDTIEDCEVVYTLSTDLNTGQNPFDDANAITAPGNSNALCDDPDGGSCATVPVIDELYLIDSTGTKKTIIGRKLVGHTGDAAIGMVRMEGEDIDQNGVIDVFSCTDDYSCEDSPVVVFDVFNQIKLPFITDVQDVIENGITLPGTADLAKPFDPNDTHFIPITPLGIDIKELEFVLNPIEDPYKAFGEPNMQNHPSVTIIMTAGLSDKTKISYPGNFQDITIQTTVAAGVIGNVNSYPPTNDTTWIQNVVTESVP